MKRKIIAVLLAGAVVFCGTVIVSAEETEDSMQTETALDEDSDEEIKMIGTQQEDAYEILLTNNTGKGIKDIRIIISGEEKSEDADNLLEEEDVFADGEQRCLCFAPVQEDEEEEKEESEEKEDDTEKTPVIYDICLVFEDDAESVLHTFPFGDIEEGEIAMEDEVAYIVFESLVLKEEVNTLENEKDLAEKKKAAEAPAQTSSQNSGTYTQSAPAQNSYSQSYYEDDEDYDDYEYYEDYEDYDDSSYDDIDYEGGSGQDDGGDTSGQDSCLDGGILY